MPPQKDRSTAAKPAAVPRPSASVLLISPTNQILLLHRVRTSSAFPSAHVFPGGNLSSFHDGDIPAPDSSLRHVDGPAYRWAAIRETFEESGILLAKEGRGEEGGLLRTGDEEREKGRKEVHGERVRFGEWLEEKGGRADIDNLIPFTRWVTPPNLPRRFTTQMYIYLLPLSTSSLTLPTSDSTSDPTSPQTDSLIPVPTTDGGIEHTAARFAHASSWLTSAQSGSIILFPPQFFLLYLLSPFLPSPSTTPHTHAELSAQRASLLSFLQEGDPPWAEKCISPTQILRRKEDGRAVLGLEKPGAELEGSGRRGEVERVVLVEFKREGPRRVEVRLRKEVLEEERKGVAGKL